MIVPNVRNDKSDNPKTRKRQPISTENSVGMRIIELLDERDLGWLSRETGIAFSTLSDYVQKGISKSENAVKIADALAVSIDLLLTGRNGGQRHSPAVALADEVSWEQIPLYDLRNFSDAGKGEPRSATPFRKDWLYRTFGRSKDLWITSLISDYSPLGFTEGDQVICCDITRAELAERQLCLWRISLLNQTLIGRYSMVHKGNTLIAEDEGEYWVNPHLVEGDMEHGMGADIVPIGRILGRVLQRI